MPVSSSRAARHCLPLLTTGDGWGGGERRAVPPDQRPHAPDGLAHGVRARQLRQPRPGKEWIGVTTPASPLFLLFQSSRFPLVHEIIPLYVLLPSYEYLHICNAMQAALARLEALEVVDLNDDEYGSTDEEDPGQFLSHLSSL